MAVVVREARLRDVCLGLGIGSLIAWSVAAVSYFCGLHLPG